MATQHNQKMEQPNKRDILLSKPSTSRFLFLTIFFCLFIFAWSGCFRLSQSSFDNTVQEAPDNTLYNPKYK